MSRSLDSIHESLVEVARRIGGKSSCSETVSRHELSSTVSFASINQLFEIVRLDAGTAFIASYNDSIVFSYNYFIGRSVKRRNEDCVDVDKLLLPLQSRVSNQTLTHTRIVAASMLQLTGPMNERVCQTLVVSHEKLHASDSVPRVVLAALLLPSTAISVSRLKNALGGLVDGLITTDTSHALVQERKLTRTDEIRLSEKCSGARPIALLTAITPKTD